MTSTRGVGPRMSPRRRAGRRSAGGRLRAAGLRLVGSAIGLFCNDIRCAERTLGDDQLRRRGGAARSARAGGDGLQRGFRADDAAPGRRRLLHPQLRPGRAVPIGRRRAGEVDAAPGALRPRAVRERPPGRAPEARPPTHVIGYSLPASLPDWRSPERRALRQPHPAQLPAAVRAEFPWREQDRSGDRARQRPRRCGADDVGNPAQSRAGPTRSAPFRPGTLRAHPARLGARHRRSDAAQSRHQRPAGASRPAQARRGRRTRSLADGAARRLRPFVRPTSSSIRPVTARARPHRTSCVATSSRCTQRQSRSGAGRVRPGGRGGRAPTHA